MTDFARTVVVDVLGKNFLQWPTAHLGQELDYFVDASAPLAYDLLASVSVSVSPSGAGELQVTDVTVTDSTVRVKFSNGVAGRVYQVRVDATTEIGREFSWVPVLPFSSEGAIPPFPAPPVADFGAPFVWTYSGPVRPLPPQPVRVPATFTGVPFVSRMTTINPSGQVFLQWPVGEANQQLDYYLDTVAAIYQDGDEISSLQISVAPSGAGELVISYVSMDLGIIRLDFTGGVPGRLYRVRISVNTLLGRDYSWVVNLPISREYAVGPFPVAPDPGFGNIATWAMIVLEDGSGFWRLENDLGNWVWG
jgi:hypothetical protein